MQNRLYFKLSWASIIVILLAFNGCNDDGEDKPSYSVFDVDGNGYSEIKIGTRTWLKENLKTTHFKDGSPIAKVEGETQWNELTTPAYCWYSNNAVNKNTYGALYNGFAVRDSRGLCPEGWHVSTDEDWADLELALGMPEDAINSSGIRGEFQNVGGKLKSIRYWNEPNSGANNQTGFAAYGTGLRRQDEGFQNVGRRTGFYTTNLTQTDKHWVRFLGYDYQGIDRIIRFPQNGLCVRCVKD